MNKEIIFRKIGGIISEIEEQYQFLASNPQNINPLELELFVANVHFLSEHLSILKKLDDNQAIMPNALLNEHSTETDSLESGEGILRRGTEEISVIYPAQATEEADFVESIEEKSTQAAFENPDVFETEEPVSIIDQENIQELRADIIEETTVQKQAMPDLMESADPDPVEEFVIKHIESEQGQNIVSSITDKVLTLNEVLSASKDKNSAPAVSYNEVKDLKSMIKLNDKLLFVRDLFNGYSLAYSEAIELLSRFGDFKTADNFLKQNYATKNRWSEKQSTVDYFYEILKRRFD